MKRNLWEFEYTADTVLEAAKVKVNHHTERFEWWTKKKEEVMAKIRADGIEIDESLAADLATSGYSNSGYRGPVVNVRNDLVVDLNETIQKTNEHRDKVKEYNAWVEVLSTQNKLALRLNQDDWLYFFGK